MAELQQELSNAAGGIPNDSNGEDPSNCGPSLTLGTNATNPQRTPASTKARKRTKTGCLTCRKRRIKCGEERPTCNNCIKSKRNCEGYTPRVIFKNPLGAYRPTGASRNGGAFSLLPMQGKWEGQYGYGSTNAGNMAALAPLAPRPSVSDNQVTHGMPLSNVQRIPPQKYHHPTDHAVNAPVSELDLPPRMRHNGAHHYASLNKVPIKVEVPANPPRPGDYQAQTTFRHGTTSSSDSGVDMTIPCQPPVWSASPDSAKPLANGQLEFKVQDVSPTTNGISGQVSLSTPMVGRYQNEHLYSFEHPDGSGAYDEQHNFRISPQEFKNEFEADLMHGANGGFATYEYTDYPYYSGGGDALGIVGNAGHYSGGSLLEKQRILPLPHTVAPFSLDAEDDYWDIDSHDDEMTIEDQGDEPRPDDLGFMLTLPVNSMNHEFRPRTNFLDGPNMLSTYHPSLAASPLMDRETARIFCHFVTITAPTLSTCERRVVNPTAMFSGTPVPKFQQALFTYTVPMLALQNQGLLYAILAMGGLHLARLQKTSYAPSLKHYHYALRRVAKALGNPVKRQHVSTLAATLLLGFYEVCTAEHSKWNSHLAGARELMANIDFLGTTRRIKEYKRLEKMRTQHEYNYELDQDTYDLYQTQTYHDSYGSNDFNIDDNLISIIMGRHIRYDRYGTVIDETQAPTPAKPITPKEIEMFEMQCDLFWWYAKQDTYQSLISGNRLLLPYERWSHIQPRAPINRLDAVYGTMDHLMLLIARIADFAGKDLKRKLRANPMGPPPNIQSSSNINRSSSNGTQPPTTQIPSSIFGMQPSPQPSTPTAFQQFGHAQPRPSTTSTSPTTTVDVDLPSQTNAALAEWTSICQALDAFESSLGPDFQPLPATHVTPLSTPFGPALFYRTYTIACIWTCFLTGRIIAMRVHPSMPPAAMVAAGVAAPRTAQWANMIGRVNAGLQPIDPHSPLNPAHGAALMDGCMGLFHAGIQYTDAAQRGWTVTKLHEVARLTGWETTAVIASGCEKAWMRAAELGKGPPYTWTMDRTAKDDRVAGRGHRTNVEGGEGGKYGEEPSTDNEDRRFVHVTPGMRVHYAMGVLSMEEDMEGLKI